MTVGINSLPVIVPSPCEPSGLGRLDCKTSICDCFEFLELHLFVACWWRPPDKGINGETDSAVSRRRQRHHALLGELKALTGESEDGFL